MTGPSLRPCRDGLTSEGCPWELPSGALMFVLPWQYRKVVIELEDMELFPDHVVFAASLEYLVEEALSRSKCTCKSIRELGQVTASTSDVATVGSEFDADDANQDSPIVHVCEFVVKRTFIHCRPIVQSSSRVAASTTDAHLGGGANP